MRKSRTFLGVILIATGLTGCFVAKNQSSAVYKIAKGEVIHDTYGYTVEDNFKGMNLHLDVGLEEGSVSFELKDPTGKVQWDGVIDKVGLDEEKDFDKIVGEWTLNFTSIEKSAEGEINLEFNRD